MSRITPDELENELSGIGGLNKGSLSNIGGEGNNSQILKQALENVSSDEPSLVIQNSEFTNNDIFWVTALEVLDAMIVTPFCDIHIVRAFRKFKNRLYQSRVSLKRQGRKEWFDAIKSETQYINLLQQNDRNRTI